MDQVLETEKDQQHGSQRCGTNCHGCCRVFEGLFNDPKAQSLDDFNAQLENAASLLLKTRPTAVSLSNAIRMVMKYRAEDVDGARQAVFQRQ